MTQAILTIGTKFTLYDREHMWHGRQSVITNVGKTKISYWDVNPETRQSWRLGAKQKHTMTKACVTLKWFNEQIEMGRFIIN